MIRDKLFNISHRVLSIYPYNIRNTFGPLIRRDGAVVDENEKY
jgi:hypothetical protein